MKQFCVRCRKMHEKGACPAECKAHAFSKVQSLLKENFYGASPNIFVGHYGYPSVNLGFLSPPGATQEEAITYDSPHEWNTQGLSIGDVIGLRSGLVNSRFTTDVKSARFKDRFVEIGQEIAMAKKPAEIEVNLFKKPVGSPRFDAISSPMGPGAQLKNAILTSNPGTIRVVDKVVSDTDLDARGAVDTLIKKGIDEYNVTSLMSAGTLGHGVSRKLVPTRWAITAVDDMAGQYLINHIRDNRECEIEAYFGSHLGNYFMILTFPGPFSYELFEISLGTHEGPVYTTDYEDCFGRKTYATNTAGGYYAARFPILQHFDTAHRKGSVLVIRFITDEYTCPLGVWVVREAVKNTMAQQPITFDENSYALGYLKALAQKKFSYSLDTILKNSKIIADISQQSKLTSFLK